MMSLKSHNILDYILGVFLVLSPYVFNFADVISARNVFLTLGYALLGYSLVTKYFYSLAKIIPLSVHMFLDVMAGVVLMLAPTVFNYRADITEGQYVFHFVMGLATLSLVTFTKNKTQLLVTVLPAGLRREV